MRLLHAALLAAALTTAATVAAVAPPTVRKITMEDQAFPAPYRTVTVKTIISGGGDVAPHTHPGLEMAFVVAGAAVVSFEGQAGQLNIEAGGSFAVPAGVVHSVHNPGSGVLEIVSTYVVKAGEPITTPAPNAAH